MLNFARKVAFYTTLPAATLFCTVDTALAAGFNFTEATVDSIQSGLRSGATTCTDITQQYLSRIDPMTLRGQRSTRLLQPIPTP